MHIIKEDTTLVGISELRTKFNKVMDALLTTKVLLEKRNKPVAVILPIEKYSRLEEIIELIEDTCLGYLARERDIKSKTKEYIDLDAAEKKLKSK